MCRLEGSGPARDQYIENNKGKRRRRSSDLFSFLEGAVKVLYGTVAWSRSVAELLLGRGRRGSWEVQTDPRERAISLLFSSAFGIAARFETGPLGRFGGIAGVVPQTSSFARLKSDAP